MEAGKETIAKIEELVKKGLTVEVEGRAYSAERLNPVMYIPSPKTIMVHNLRGFCGFIREDIDKRITGNAYLIVVDSPELVYLTSKLNGENLEREMLIESRLDRRLERFPFGEFMSQEAFAIRFRSLFTPKEGDDFEYILAYVSRLAGGTEIVGEDDGITQQVQVKRGISGALKDPIDLKAIVKLSPYRTFREVEQPESEFLLRVRMTKDRNPEAALFEADGGRWVNEATDNIVRYIQSEAPDIPVIA
jgi:hypothetical protein